MTETSRWEDIRRLALSQFSGQMAFARVSAELIILECTDNWQDVLPDESKHPDPGVHIAECFEEFFGLESYLGSIMQSRRPLFRLERINRSDPAHDQERYFDLSLSGIDGSSDMLLTVEDMTEFGRLEQTIVQERNELRLIRGQLAQANEELHRLDRFKSLFFAMAAHDLRSPLMTVRGYADLLGMIVNQSLVGEIAERSTEFIDTIKVQADWLDKMIYNILELNRIESGKQLMEKELCNARDLVRHAVEAVAPMAKLSDQNLTMSLPDDGILLNGDPRRIEQCVTNLISNAVKYTPPGGNIEVSMRQVPDAVDIVVADNGRGMNEDQLENVFDLYYRTPDARESVASGTGLGLFVVKSIVEAHDGDIKVVSQPGQGASFTMRLPIHKD